LAWIGGASVTVCLGIILLLSLNAAWTFVSTYETAYYAGARDRVYRDVGRWLAENSNPDASVAMTEVGTIGYFSQRRIIDLMGLVTYELRDLPKQGDYHATIDALRPDYIVAARGLPPDPNLDGFDGYSVVQEFPRSEQNLFEDVVIYAINKD
jgi:hypothetical protein